MGKYDPLGEYLSERPGDSCTLTFSEVEDIIGDSLENLVRSSLAYGGRLGGGLVDHTVQPIQQGNEGDGAQRAVEP